MLAKRQPNVETPTKTWNWKQPKMYEVSTGHEDTWSLLTITSGAEMNLP